MIVLYRFSGRREFLIYRVVLCLPITLLNLRLAFSVRYGSLLFNLIGAKCARNTSLPVVHEGGDPFKQ